MQFFTITYRNKKTRARTGILHTAHGDIKTPAFIPVATQGSVKGITIQELQEIGVQAVLGNTYHLYLRPGDRAIRSFGGLHRFMGWDGPLFTDSGGFQVFSLGAGLEHGVGKIGGKREEARKQNLKSLVKISEEGVEFQSHIDGSQHFLTPERSMQIQRNLGADIIFAFDELTSPLHSYNYTKTSMNRTHRWAIRSLQEFNRLQKKSERPFDRFDHFNEFRAGKLRVNNQFLFGIVQGGDHKDLREKSARAITTMDFDGIGIGGYVGDSKAKLYKVLSWVIPHLDPEKPRHLLGIGAVGDILEAVERGIDTFDCVIPTRYARNGTAFTTHEVLHLGNAGFRGDKQALEEGCQCYACRTTTRGYISHLFRANEMLGPILMTIHNLAFFERFLQEIRDAIPHGKLPKLRRRYKKFMDILKQLQRYGSFFS